MSYLTDIIASYEDLDIDRYNGRYYKKCPICGSIKIEEEIQSYYGPEDSGQIDCCTDCIEDFERDYGIDVIADVLEQDTFNTLRCWAQIIIEYNNDQY